MSLDAKTKELLNDFADTQPALNDRDKPFPQSKIELGTLLDEAHGAIRSARALYKPASDGGTDGEAYSLDLSIPAGALITRSWAIVNTTSSAAATLDFSTVAGSVDLGSVADATAATGDHEDKQAAPEAVPADTSVQVEVSGASVTDGEFLLIVEYIYPVK